MVCVHGKRFEWSRGRRVGVKSDRGRKIHSAQAPRPTVRTCAESGERPNGQSPSERTFKKQAWCEKRGARAKAAAKVGESSQQQKSTIGCNKFRSVVQEPLAGVAHSVYLCV